MKKILLGSFVLLFFSLSIILFQISCTKSSEAQEGEKPVTTQDVSPNDNGNAVLYLRFDENASQVELWSMNLSGSNDHKINIVLPDGWLLVNYSTARVIAKTNKIIFTAFSEVGFEYHYAFFSCNLDGSGVLKIKEGPAQTLLNIQDLFQSGGGS